jgi:hypothetical protein
MFWYYGALFALVGYFIGFIHGLIAEEKNIEGIPVRSDNGPWGHP